MARKSISLSGLAVRGFKSICDEQQVDLRPLTILAGANSSGKSSIMQPLPLLKQIAAGRLTLAVGQLGNESPSQQSVLPIPNRH